MPENLHPKKLLFLSWRDIAHPKAGGAEVFTHEMLKRLAKDHQYEIHHFSVENPNSPDQEIIDDVTYYRSGNALSVILAARKHLQNHQYEAIIDQCNTHHFFSFLWAPKSIKRIFFIHQLTREIWYTNLPWFLALWGRLLESWWLKAFRDYDQVLTVSQSTADDLVALHFDPEKIIILPEGLNFKPWTAEELAPKNEAFTLLYVGRFVAYKGIEDTIRALAILVKKHSQIRLELMGSCSQSYRRRLERMVIHNGLKNNVFFHGFVSDKKKKDIMSRSQVLVFPSIREGWGLVITEANAVGTPALVYDAPGTRDAVQNGTTGIITEQNTPQTLAWEVQVLLENPHFLKQLNQAAHADSQNFHWDNTGKAAQVALSKLFQS